VYEQIPPKPRKAQSLAGMGCYPQACPLFLWISRLKPTLREKTMSQFKNYRKKNLQAMRPYVPGEDLTGISVNKEDTPEEGGMIAVNASNAEDKWYVGKKFFEENYELAQDAD
jgi:hypothetical protein